MNIRHCTYLGKVCSESELSDHIGKCRALVFISALSTHLQISFASKLSLNIQLNQVVDRWWCGIPLAPESTWPHSRTFQADPVTHIFVRL